MNNKNMVDALIKIGVLKTPTIIKAFHHIDRRNFVPASLKNEAYKDFPLPIGEGQTISQPYTVAFMIEELQPTHGNKTLEIGAGSGWVTALLSYLVGKSGYIWAYEINKTVGRFGTKNLQKKESQNLQYVIDNAKKHWQEHAPYDRIVSGAAFEKWNDIYDLLADPGIAVIPISPSGILKIAKDGRGNIKEGFYQGFVFVPFVQDKND